MSNTLKKIKDELNYRMGGYKDSREPSHDEAKIIWLVAEVEELTERLKRKTIKS